MYEYCSSTQRAACAAACTRHQCSGPYIYIYRVRERDIAVRPRAGFARAVARRLAGVEDAYSRYRADIPGPPLHGQLHSTLLCCREASCAHECALYIMHLVRLYCVFAMGGARFYTRPTTFIYGLYGFTLFGRLGGGIFRREPGRVYIIFGGKHATLTRCHDTKPSNK